MKLACGLGHTLWILSHTLEVTIIIGYGFSNDQRTTITLKKELDVLRFFDWLIVLEPDHLLATRKLLADKFCCIQIVKQ